MKIDHTNHYKAGDTGKYFIFSKDDFSKMVGHENWNAKEIHITQEGSHMWSGKVTVWVGTSKYESHGRKSEGAANGDWEKDDSIKLAGCKPSRVYCILVHVFNHYYLGIILLFEIIIHTYNIFWCLCYSPIFRLSV